MNRYFIPPAQWSTHDAGYLLLSGEEAKHCTRVMRARVGDQVELFDGAGRSSIAEIESLSRSEVKCLILSSQDHDRVPHPLTLCQSIPKGGNMELIVQKAVELGVSKIQPLITAHTVARPESLSKKQAKWQRIALEACKQCGQNFLPEVAEPMVFSTWIQQWEPCDTRLIAALDERAEHLKSLLSSKPIDGSVAFLVGPEGDFSPAEYQAAYAAGFNPISFGDIIMRVETATLFGVSIIQHEISSLDLG